jgi:hypothetical protein
MLIQDLEYLETLSESSELADIQGSGFTRTFSRSTTLNLPNLAFGQSTSSARARGKLSTSAATSGSASFLGALTLALPPFIVINTKGSSAAAGGGAFAFAL